MRKVKLTKRMIDDAAPRIVPSAEGEGGEAELKDRVLWDLTVPGLHLRVTPRGAKVFYAYYRTLDGTQRRPKVGAYGQVTLDQARDIAASILARARAGEDPSADRKRSKEALTVEQLCDRFLEEHAEQRKPATLSQYTGLVNRHVKPALGSRKAASVNHDDVAKLIRQVGAAHQTSANRLRAMLRVMFKLAERWGLRPQNSNPVAHVDRYQERKRHRHLSAEEMVRFAKALEDADEADGVAVAAIKVIALTGCRRSEIEKLTWQEVDLAQGVLRIIDSKTGPKVVFLNDAAKAILEAQPKGASSYVFPCAWSAKKPVDATYAWKRLRKRAGLDGEGAMRVHDLRHHFASTAAGAGMSLPMIGALLGHKSPQTTARYAELADHPARRASEEIGRAIAEAMRVAEPGE